MIAGVSILLKSVDNQIPDDVLINNDDTLYYGLHGMPKMFKLEYSEADLSALVEKIKGCNGQNMYFLTIPLVSQG